MDPEIQQKVCKFETIVNDVLKADLAELEKKLDEKNTDLVDLIQLKSVITIFQDINATETGFKTKVDIGSSFFIQAEVTDVSKILLDVGLGHYVEFTLHEAIVVINVRIKLLEKQIANLRKAIAKTNAHIKLILLTIKEIQGLN